MSTDPEHLRDQLDTAIRARHEVARAAQVDDNTWYSLLDLAGPQPVYAGLREEDARLMALNDPATVIRMCERDLRVLQRHRVRPLQPAPDCRCEGCVDAHMDMDMDVCDACRWTSEDDAKVCDDVRDLAVAYGLLDPAGE